jgi:DNA-binding beta-propeller fold protein YncE
MRHASLLLLLLLLILVTGAIAASDPAKYDVRNVPLPGGSDAGVSMDYIAFDPATGFVWVPAGNTGRVDVIDTKDRSLKEITGFPTAEMGNAQRKRIVGPSSATVGKGWVYVGNRADSTVCAINAKTLARGACGKLDAMPDGLAYVAATKEVWVTTPRDNSVRVLDATTMKQKAKLTFEGGPEGFAVDAKRNRFYTNLEDKDRTLAIDVKTRKTVKNWPSTCGEDGPRGLSLDEKDGFLFVACTTRAEVMDIAHDGKVLSSIDTGAGVDDLGWSASSRKLYIAAGQASQLTVASVDAAGQLHPASQVAIPKGTRNGIVTRGDAIYAPHSAGSEIVVVTSPR